MQETAENSSSDSSSDEPSQSDEPFDQTSDDSWSYESGRKALIGIEGEAREYAQNFIFLVEVTPSSETASLENLDGLVDEDGSLTDRIDLSESPYEVQSQLVKTKANAGASQQKDSNNFVKKCEQTLNQHEMLTTLGEGLYEGDLEEVESFLRSLFSSEIFPGSAIDMTVKIGSDLEPDASEESPEQPDEQDQQEEEQDVEDQSKPMFLDVVPEVNPSTGVPLKELSSDEEIEVRVVGSSVTELRDQFRASSNGDGSSQQSKPLYARLMKIDSTNSAEAEFVVKITNEVYGKGTVDPNTMVELRREEDIPSHIILRRKILNGLVVLLIAVFSASVLILLFPDSFLALLELLQ